MTSSPEPGTDARVIEQLFEAAWSGDVPRLAALLDADPERLHARAAPYDTTLLHAAAHAGRLPAVDLLLTRGLDPNVRESGDNTYPMHWAAAAGHLDVVRLLADAGGDVVGRGDDHALEVIGWASAWEGCDDDAHRAIVDLLVSRGARHHIFSAIAMNLASEVRRIVATDPSALAMRMSRNENNQTPLHFAVRMHRPDMVALLLELGADPLTVDASGQSVATYADEHATDRAVMEAIRTMTLAELASADRAHRPAHGGTMDLIACMVLGDWETAERLAAADPQLPGQGGVLHLFAKRGNAGAVRWLLEHGADANARWAHYDAVVTPLHMAAWGGSVDVTRLLLAAGADPRIRDTKHDGDADGWAEHFGRTELLPILRAQRTSLEGA